MSKYTTELRFICETEAGETESVGYSEVDDIITAALPHIFDFDFPIFDENYRVPLETKIIRHYYTREIGLETYGLWKLKLQTKLNEIMPYYNKLYESELYTYNPLYDVDLTTTNVGQKTGENTNVDSRISNKTNSGNTTSNGSNNVERKGNETNTGATKNSGTRNYQRDDAYSDTPQGTLNNVKNLNYLTNARNIVDTEMTNEYGDTTGASTSENSQTETNQQTVNTIGSETDKNEGSMVGTSKSTEDYVLHVMGKSAGTNYARMIKDFRDNLLNIDMDVIRELNDLFMMIW